MPTTPRVDILFLAKNRREMTRESVGHLVSNTNFRFVNCLTFWDDGSEDGTAELLRDFQELLVPDTCLCIAGRKSNLGSPVEIAYDHAQESSAEFVAKIDNDCMVPPGWLNEAVRVMEADPRIEVLGLEDPVLVEDDRLKLLNRDPSAARGWRYFPWVGGLYLARRTAYDGRPPVSMHDTYWGWADWLEKNRVCCGWLEPPLPVFVLDRLPFEPWLSLSTEYERRGWQRPWQKYDREKHAYLWEWAGLETSGVPN